MDKPKWRISCWYTSIHKRKKTWNNLHSGRSCHYFTWFSKYSIRPDGICASGQIKKNQNTKHHGAWMGHVITYVMLSPIAHVFPSSIENKPDTTGHALNQCPQTFHTKCSPCFVDSLTYWGRDKWTPFRRRHFQMYFLEWKCLNSD